MICLTYLRFDKHGDENCYQVLVDERGAFDISLNFFDEFQVECMAQALDIENFEGFTFVPGDWAAAHVDSETGALIERLKVSAIGLVKTKYANWHQGALND
jgi:hypothetical protein